MSKNFTIDAVTEALHAIVAEKGEDYVYPYAPRKAGGTCKYSETDGSPSCIVGHVVAALEPDIFAQVVEVEAQTGGSTDASTLLHGWVDYSRDWTEPAFSIPAISDDPDLSQALQIAQIAQDGGLPWGDALEFYERWLSGGESYRDIQDEINFRIRRRYPVED